MRPYSVATVCNVVGDPTLAQGDQCENLAVGKLVKVRYLISGYSIAIFQLSSDAIVVCQDAPNHTLGYLLVVLDLRLVILQTSNSTLRMSASGHKADIRIPLANVR